MRDETIESIREAITEALGEALDCTRVWSAWQVGTMGPDDFVRIADDHERVEELVQAVLQVLRGDQIPACELCAKGFQKFGDQHYDEGGFLGDCTREVSE